MQKELDWRQDEINLYGKQVLIPRLQAWYGDKESFYQYSGLSLAPIPWTESLSILKDKIEKNTQFEFNSMLANLYRDQKDSVAWHSDDEEELGLQPTIASFSLGAERVFQLKHKITGERFKLPLQSGSLLIMAGDTQKYWQHAVLKQQRQIGPRINLTFRKIFPKNFY